MEPRLALRRLGTSTRRDAIIILVNWGEKGKEEKGKEGGEEKEKGGEGKEKEGKKREGKGEREKRME